MEVVFSEKAIEDLCFWKESNNIKAQEKITQLIKSFMESPFKGIGKPEPLKYGLAGYWSRRITAEHRLVYKVDNDKLIIIALRFHY
ncbi:Txe/YoeB family addiction module toxin [Solitalea canadensis]|uniref:Putative mRNA interferase YoeB n=1 Tax=Solitalea canadensis (strain ATCC 29591 / DSM 3403 / JCM 21819 / LMG 8368 / NBRC 15130 / NCIMB 12057 / USAM 9D) TaxID=929556 RepID=H8KLR0_SOLCM|nr:Txe/YoeB family addiction module toxin [Solitalea canadensis]AFD09214.1 toxin-antitoxin system, toxin component, Txe/YoeB family [Solitalea canadensis DSM 3403]